MKSLIQSLREYLRADFHPRLYLATAMWLGLLIILNYTLDFEDVYIDSLRGSWKRPVLYILLYTTVYYVAMGLWTYYHHRPDLWRNRRFWLHTSVGWVTYGFYAGFYGYNRWSEQLLDGQIYLFAYYCLSNLHSLVTLVLPLYLYYRFFDNGAEPFYGLKPKRDGLAVYALLLLVMVPLIAFASFQPHFLDFYPTYKDTTANEFLGVPEWVTALVYELCYGWDFVPTELMFRGFMVIGLSRITATDKNQSGVILPMVVAYASIHFGKPLGETLSSILGGYLLGVLALSTQSIWGGLLIHLSIAWLMDGAAFVQQWVQQPAAVTP
ncbi:CPBP family intramembrane glutamic endopeptidase [Rudanella lutea]|uniref:CPBP family intramembrane glutamic endopeptidase n=1 Tax=Rudanella lutea TaxID=451374 RepID=UPI0003711891|nr:CPBP family intramembrane glutamic endopeptidase [Rudanella lutea]